MIHTFEDVHHLFHEDVNLDFLETFANTITWEYNNLRERIEADETIPDFLKHDEFSIGRSGCGTRALQQACRRHVIPLHHFRLECNGQIKVFVKMGRVLLIHETLHEFPQKPLINNYKKILAETIGVSQQMELNIDEKTDSYLDKSGDVLGVLLHGSAGSTFSKRDMALGGLMLAIPDDKYKSWVARFDLRHLGMFGSRTQEKQNEQILSHQPIQRDEVFVAPKLKKKLIGY